MNNQLKRLDERIKRVEYNEGYKVACYGKKEHRAFNPYLGDDSSTGIHKLFAWYDGFDAGLKDYQEEMGIKRDNWGR